MTENRGTIPADAPIDKGLHASLEALLSAVGVSAISRVYIPRNQVGGLAKYTNGSWTAWLLTDIGIAESKYEIVPGRVLRVEVGVVPWSDVRGVRLSGSIEYSNEAEITTVKLAIDHPAFEDSATQTFLGGADVPELRSFAQAVTTGVAEHRSGT